MNKIFLHGFTGKDPEVKMLESGKKIAKLTLATTSFRKDKDGNKITEWHNLIVWEKLTELCEKYIKKGSEIIVEGEITYRDYIDKGGVKKYFTEIICSSIEFCGKKEESKQDAPTAKEENWQGKKEIKSMSDPNDLPGANEPEDNLPF
jgi:single-strand DNA-binding protein